MTASGTIPEATTAEPADRTHRVSPRHPRRTGSRVDAVLPERWVARRRRLRVAQAYAAVDRVQAGPFAGMVLAGPPAHSRVPKLIGSYEAGLHPTLQRLLARGPGLVLHVGCAEGYYAVGIARLLPEARVLGFDPSEQAREALVANAAANQVHERVGVRDRCHQGSLGLMMTVPTLVIVDDEAAWPDVLGGDNLSRLATADLVVELCDASRSRLDALAEPLRATHQLAVIADRPRDPIWYPALAALSAPEQALALAETRDARRSWLIAAPIERE